MAGYNYGNYGNFSNYGATTGYPQTAPVYAPQPTVNVPQPPQSHQPSNPEGKIFVHGRAGAEAFQMPNGVYMIDLWDDEQDRFYVKGYDNSGRPRILADNDYQPHIEPEPPAQPQPIDMSAYPTKDDISAMIQEAFGRIQFPNTSNFVTRQDFDAALNSLSVGNGGRIVRTNESNA